MEKRENKNLIQKPFIIGDTEGRGEKKEEGFIRPFSVGSVKQDENSEENQHLEDIKTVQMDDWDIFDTMYDDEEIPFWKEQGYWTAGELIPHFFDSPKKKEKKKRILSGLTIEQKQELESEIEMLENYKFEDNEITPADIYGSIPSIFDDKKTYEIKYNYLKRIAPEVAKEVRPVDQVKLISCKHVVNASEFVPVDKAQFRVGDFWYEDGELLYQSEGMDGATLIGNFWIEILQEIVHVSEICNDQNMVVKYQEETSWAVNVYCMGQVFEAEEDVKSLMSENEVLRITKDRAYIEPTSKRLYRKLINLLIAKSKFKEIKLYERTGWIQLKRDKWVYLTDQGIIGESDSKIKADVPYHFRFDTNALGSKQVFWDFWEMRHICKKSKNSVFLMHYACVAVMTTLFQNAGKGVNFIVALIGATNSYKTTVGILFSRLFDRTATATPDIRFNSTEVAIMEKMSAYGDAILMVDDFVPFTSGKQMSEQMKKSETIIRSYGDREPRKRSQVYAKINNVPEYSPIKGCCLITGEIFKTESESSDTRVIQLQFETGDVDLDMLTYYQEHLMNYPTFLYDFILYLQGHIPTIEQTIKEEIRRVRADHPNAISTPRFVDTLAIMTAEIHIFYEYAVEKTFITKEEAERQKEDDLEVIVKIIEKNDHDAKTKSPGTLICLALREGMKTEALKLYYLSEAKDLQTFEGILLEDENYFYILPETLWKLWKTYCRAKGLEMQYKTGRELNAPLRKENLLLIKTEGKNQQQRATHKIGNFSSKRFFIIKKREYERLCRNFEQF